MPELDLGRLEALANAATPGPWEALWPGQCCDTYCVPAASIHSPTQTTKADAEFIAAAREGVPELIAENRRLQGVIEGESYKARAAFEDEHQGRAAAERAWGRWQRRAETAEAEVVELRETLAARMDELAQLKESLREAIGQRNGWASRMAEFVNTEAERNALAVKVAAVRELTYASDDGTEFVHLGHESGGEPDCPACWAADIRKALEVEPNHTGATTPESAAAGPETGTGASSTPSGHTDSPPEIPGPQIGAQR